MVWLNEIQEKYDIELQLAAHAIITVTMPAVKNRLTAEMQSKNEELQIAISNPTGNKQTWLSGVETLKSELSSLIERDDQIIKDNREAYENYIKAVETEATAHAAEDTVKWKAVRNTRNWLLSFCDWTQLQDAPLTSEKKANWAAYRVALRNIPETYQTVESIVWPTNPV